MEEKKRKIRITNAQKEYFLGIAINFGILFFFIFLMIAISKI
jgi:hypothetical protein